MVFLADGPSGLQVIKIEDPTEPQFEGAVDTPGLARDIAIDHRFAYIADDTGLQIVDVSVTAWPVLAGAVAILGGARGIAVESGYAYLACQAAGLQLIDVADPDMPLLAGLWNTPGNACGVAIRKDCAYVADDEAGLQVIDIAEPLTPLGIGWAATPGMATRVVVAADRVCVADGAAGLQIAWRHCAGGTPTFLSSFHVDPGPGTACIHWTVTGIAVTRDFRLRGRQDASCWEVPCQQDGPGRFLARDEPVLTNGSTSVTYSLYHSTDGTGWRQLSSKTVNLAGPGGSIAASHALAVYPNPANPHLTVSFDVYRPRRLRLSVLDLSGRRIAVLADGFFSAASHSIVWDGKNTRGGNAPSGTYLVRLQGRAVPLVSQKVTLLR